MPRPQLKRRADGRYQCEYKGKYFYGTTQSEAYAKRAAYKRELERGLRVDAAGVTVRDYAMRWITIYKSGVTAKTYNAYARHLNAACTILGDMRMRDVVQSDIQQAYNARSGYSRSDIAHYTQAISAVFRAALVDRLITHDPTAGAKPPKGVSGTHRPLEQWERDAVHAAVATGQRFALAAMVMLYAGLRRGEVLALDIDRDIDRATHTIHVHEAVRYASNAPILTSPKTKAGKRSVPLVGVLERALDGHHGLVAQAGNGGHMSEVSFRRAWAGYLRTLERITGRPVTIQTHDFRHSYCTMLYELGIDIKSAQKWMGHADESITRQIYTHLSDRQEQEAIKRLHEGLACQNACQSPIQDCASFT